LLTLYGAIFELEISGNKSSEMKKSKILAVIVMLPLLGNVINAQSPCKVLNPKIGESYTGLCKQGLADGNGEALGVDQYKGEFKKGLPDGTGTYIWQTGEKYEGSWKKGFRDGEGNFTFKYEGRDSVLSGVWKEDKYIGEKVIKPYVILYKNSITRVSCVRMGDIPYVEYKFSRTGGKADDIRSLFLQGSTGDENISSNFIGFEQTTFPFEGKVRFEAPNSFYTSTLSCELRLLISQPGSWIITIYY
jgi:hypothetical protein